MHVCIGIGAVVGGVPRDVGMEVRFAQELAQGADFAFESVVLFEDGLYPFVPWGGM